jgi:hypothetical protein
MIRCSRTAPVHRHWWRVNCRGTEGSDYTFSMRIFSGSQPTIFFWK